jgi:hypothetical protein
MNRRAFLGSAAAFFSKPVYSIHLTPNHAQPIGAIPNNFMGLGYEISSVAKTGLLSGANRKYVDLVRGLGAHGVIRIGGNTSDYAKFVPAAAAVSTSKATIINSTNLRDLGTFLDATGWDLIWGLNLGRGSEQEAVEEARAVASAVKGRLFALEIGNEPDLFGNHATHRPEGYGYSQFLAEYRRYKSAIRRVLPNVSFAGPDVASATNWIQKFVADEGSDLKLLTHHYYRECANPTSTLDKLLHTDPKLAPILAQLKYPVPYRICETNSFCGGGKAGVSDTFGSALWVLDFMFKLAMGGAAGVNIETGVNQKDFISYYSPIPEDSAAPEYFGMLAFARASRGTLIPVDYDPGLLNIAAYAVQTSSRQLTLTIVNKEPSLAAEIVIGQAVKAHASLLTAPSLESKGNVTISPHQSVKVQRGECRVHVPAASAAIITLES